MRIEATLITSPTNIRYLSGFKGTYGQILITKNKKYLLTDSRYIEVANKLTNKESTTKQLEIINISPLGYEKTFEKLIQKEKITKLFFEPGNMTIEGFKKLKTILKGYSQFSTLGSQFSIESLRYIKSNDEIKLLKKSQSINDEIFAEIKKQLKIGQTEKEIGWKIKEFAYLKNCEDISFEPIVAINEHSAVPHHHPTSKKLKKGDILLIDMGLKYNGYCSDMTRVIFTKKPTQIEQNIYSTVLKAQKNAISKIKAGMKCSQIDAFARDLIKEAGYFDNFGHSTGHGIGLDIHEKPALSAKSKDVLKENVAVTIEPGIYLSGKFGIRIEDMIIVGKNASENITKSPKELEELVLSC